jgi:hypothetical protein
VPAAPTSALRFLLARPTAATFRPPLSLSRVQVNGPGLVPPWDDLVNDAVRQVEGVKSVEILAEDLRATAARTLPSTNIVAASAAVRSAKIVRNRRSATCAMDRVLIYDGECRFCTGQAALRVGQGGATLLFGPPRGGLFQRPLAAGLCRYP